MNLVEAWLEHELKLGVRPTAAARKLSEVFNRYYTPSRVLEWRKGLRSIPYGVECWMRAEVLPVRLAELGLDRETEAKVRDLIESILVPPLNEEK